MLAELIEEIKESINERNARMHVENIIVKEFLKNEFKKITLPCKDENGQLTISAHSPYEVVCDGRYFNYIETYTLIYRSPNGNVCKTLRELQDVTNIVMELADVA